MTSALAVEAQALARATVIASSRAKRGVDLAVALPALILVIPFLMVLLLATILASGWPPLLGQTRVGLGGKTFRLWKIRTMVRGAENRQPELFAANEAPFPAFKMRRDPRVTGVGRYLRKSRLDELPQLWNVVIGQMSLVGPRPPLPSEVRHYDEYAWRRLDVKPGLACTWQLRPHASQSTFRDWVECDLEYIRDWSLRRDLALIGETMCAVLRMNGE